jgi:hypothetical protein
MVKQYGFATRGSETSGLAGSLLAIKICLGIGSVLAESG